jgi:hypothetical protein
MTNPYLLHLQSDARAMDADFAAVPHKIDDIRWTWAGDLFVQLGQMGAAERCFGFAEEHRLVAATLRGERQIGDEEIAA